LFSGELWIAFGEPMISRRQKQNMKVLWKYKIEFFVTTGFEVLMVLNVKGRVFGI
jgi:hypothetical protein